MRSLECYFGVYFPRCCATREINTKITLSWAHKQFVTRVHILFYMYPGLALDCCQPYFEGNYTLPTKSLWTVYPAADSTLTVQLFQQVAVRKPFYTNQPNKFCFKGHTPYCSFNKITIIQFTGTMYICLLNKPIELDHSTTYFAFFNFASDFHQHINN